MTLERQTDYQASGDLLAETLNKEQDTAMMVLQQLRETISRALGFKRTETSSASLQIPSPIAGYVLAWNSGATALENKLWHDSSDVATNTANIATNTSDIATNTSDIADNTSNVALKVNKAGDTMTGNLTIANGAIPKVILKFSPAIGTSAFEVQDSSNVARMTIEYDATSEGVSLNLNNSSGSLLATLSLHPSGAIVLAHGANQKLATQSTGVDVTGNMEADSYSVGGTAGATGTFANSVTVVNGIVTAGT